MEYKDTIFLPKTTFEMRGNLPTKEPKILDDWEKEKIFNKLRNKSRIYRKNRVVKKMKTRRGKKTRRNNKKKANKRSRRS